MRLERYPKRLAQAATVVLVFAAAVAANPAIAADHPSEGAMREAFEGKYGRAKVDMPASAQGVDVWPSHSPPLNYRELAERLKKYGTGVRKGEEIMVTKVHVRGDLIEFQLGGGGFGTFSDKLGAAGPVASYSGESKYEKDLKREISETKDPSRRRELQRELDKAKSERRRDNARNRTEALQAQQAAKAAAREKASTAGSRFNVRYKGGLPAEVLTPAGLQSVLADYFEIVDGESDGLAEASDSRAGDGGSVADLKKGMTREQVEAILGPAEAISNKNQEGTKVVNATYRKGGQVIEAVFVEGVLARYSIASE